jgi:hypothetical protein
METKTCSKCGIEKNVSEFHKNKLGIYGVQAQCKTCKALLKKEYRSREDVKIKENQYAKEYRKREEVIIKHREYAKEWSSKPENKEKKKIYNDFRKNNQVAHEKKLKYMREYNHLDNVKKQSKNSNLIRFYGIKIDQYELMFSQQKGLCYICGKPECSSNRQLAVDHDHATGKVRGLLCGKCNKAIGLLNDDISILKSAIEYLEKWSNE